MSSEKASPKILSADSDKNNMTSDDWDQSSIIELDIDDSDCFEFQNSFEPLYESWKNGTMTYQQFDNTMTQTAKKIMEAIDPSSLSLGTDREMICKLLEKEKKWKVKLGMIVKELKKLKKTIAQHKPEVVLKSEVVCRSVGLQKESSFLSEDKSLKFSNSIIEISDEDDDVVTLNCIAGPSAQDTTKTLPIQVASNQLATNLMLSFKSSQTHCLKKKFNFVNQSSNSAPVALSTNQSLRSALVIQPVLHKMNLAPYKHPTRSPGSSYQNIFLNLTTLLPVPILKISNIQESHNMKRIILTWDLNASESLSEISSYQIFSYVEPPMITGNSSTELMPMQIGEVPAQPLPMSILTTCEKQNKIFQYIVRAVNVNKMFGFFSEPQGIHC